MITGLKLHHIGLIVSDIDSGVRHMDALLPGLHWSSKIADPLQDVVVRFAAAERGTLPIYEIIAPTSDASPVCRALKQRRDVLNHLAYLTPNISLEQERLRNIGCMALGDAKPGIAYDNAQVQFFYTQVGSLMELIEHPGPQIVLGNRSSINTASKEG